VVDTASNAYVILVDKKIADALTEEHKLALGKFRINPKSVNFEKLAGTDNLYSLRYSRAGRLLLSQADGRYLVLAILPNHEYDKAIRSLDAGILKQLKKGSLPLETKQETPESEVLTDSLARAFEHMDISSDKRVSFEEIEIKLEDGFDENQRDALNIRMPAIVSGPAGSGILHAARLWRSAGGMGHSGDERKYKKH